MFEKLEKRKNESKKNEFGMTCMPKTGAAAMANGLGKQLTNQTF